MGLTLYLLYGVLVLKGSDFFWMCGTLERAYSMEQIQGRLRNSSNRYGVPVDSLGKLHGDRA